MAKLRLLGMSFIVLIFCSSGVLASQGYGPGRIGLKIFAGRDHADVGDGGIWNSRDKLHIQLDPADGWRIKAYHVDLGGGDEYEPPLTPTGNPKIGHFDYKDTFPAPYTNEINIDDHIFRRTLVLDLGEDLGFQWGAPWADLRTQGVAIFLSLVKIDSAGKVIAETGAWAVPELVTWSDEPEAEAAIEVSTETATEEIADGNGEVVSEEIIVIHWVGKKNKVAKKQHQKAKKSLITEESEEVISFDGGRWGWWFRYKMAHPRTGHFIDSPVEGLSVETPTYEGVTDETAAFDYFPGEAVDIAIGSIKLGSAFVDHKISPLDIFPLSNTDDPKVVNMARLLQSLDVDGEPQGGITITPEVAGAFEQAMADNYLEELNFADDNEVESIINETVYNASLLDSAVTLVVQSAEDAQAHLDASVSNSMFRKNVSKTPELASSKAKMNVMGVWLPAMKANGEPATFLDEDESEVIGIPYYDENGNLIRTATQAKPLIVTYTDADPTTGEHDVWAAVSRDDGNTWKRTNISRMADRSSFQLASGEEYYGHCKKPVFQVKGNKVLIAWTSKFAKGGKPRYAIQVCPDEDEDEDGEPDSCETCTGSDENEECGPDYIYDDPYVVDDYWGVKGSQRSVDYTDEGYPEVGEVPYSAVWTCRGIIVTAADKIKDTSDWLADKAVGDIVWFKPERLTSARRDANQVFMGGADGAGFAIAWQEDPKGLRPGEAKGPGPGWGGATANHKTDIWYSFITWGDHTKIDGNFVAGGDPSHTVQYDENGNDVAWTNRPKALVPMSLPVRISDNDAVNTSNATLLDADGNAIVAVSAADIRYEDENLTRCVKFEGGASITTPDDPFVNDYTYTVLRAVPDNHNSSMNCTNCHQPYQDDYVDEKTPQQGSPIPLVVVDATVDDYLGGFTNSDCVSCHYNNTVPRDRVVAVYDKDTCESAPVNGIWKDGSDNGYIVEAYYPYEPYPYIQPDVDDTNDGAHRYITQVSGLWFYKNDFSPDRIGLFTKTNYQGVDKTVAVTTDGRLLDGNTSATRPNLFLQTYTNNNKTPDDPSDDFKSAWAIMAYEETKGLGSGPPETTGEGSGSEDGSGYDPYEAFPDNGKNAIYHSFDFQNPDLVSGGMILNLPETDEDGNALSVVETDYLGSILNEDGTYTPIENPNAGYPILDWKDASQLAYENARRPRFILQSKASAFGGVKTDGSFKAPNNSGTVLIVLYKEGEEGAGRPSDIMARRCVVKENGVIKTGNPWSPGNFLPGAQNVSTVMVGTTWVNPERDENAKGAGTKVCDWTQPEACLGDKSGVNPYEDARAHRGAIRGDFVVMGYSYTPNWAASRNAHDKYDFYIRRSFNGGATWTTDPNSDEDVIHTDYFIDPEGISGSDADDSSDATKHYTVETTYAGGEVYEPARNVSLLKNNKTSVIEPRIVAVPGTIKSIVNGDGEKVWDSTKFEDKQNPNVFYVAYGTSTNLKDVEKAPEDLFLSFSTDQGTNFAEDIWVVNPDSSGENAGETVTGWLRLAKGDQEQGEVQIRMTPNGERFYGCWLDEGEEGSDIVFRRIMPADFDANNVPVAVEE